MAKGTGTVTVKFLGDLSDLQKKTKQAGDDVGGFGDKMGSVATKVAGAFAALGVATFLKDATQAAAEDAAAHEKLATSLRNSIGAWDGQIDSIEKWITKAQFAKGFSDTDLRDSFAQLTNVTKNVSESQRLMGVAMDLARAKGIPLAQATDILAKAHEGNTKAIKAQFPELGQLIKDNASADEIIATLTETVKGQADTFAGTAAGKAEIFHQKMGELTETIGTKLLPVMVTMANGLSKIIDWFSGLPGPVQTGIMVVTGIAGALFALNAVLGVATAAAAAFGVTLNLSLGPIALVVAAVVGIGVAIYALVKNWDTVKAALKTGIDAVLGWFSDLGGKIARLATSIWEPIWGGLKAVLNRAIDLVNTFVDVSLAPLNALNKIPGIKSLVPDVPHISHLAQGGVFSGAAIVGERGPELLVGAGRVIPNGALGGNVYNIAVTAIDPQAAQEAVVTAIREYERRNGQGWRT